MDSQVLRGMGYYLGSGSNSGSDLVERVAATCKIWELGIKDRMRKEKEGTMFATHPRHDEQAEKKEMHSF